MFFDIVIGRCEKWQHTDCANTEATQCNLEGLYSPRQWKATLQEAKDYCSQNSDCAGITKDSNGYEPRKGPSVYYNAAALELWKCKGYYLYIFWTSIYILTKMF